MVKFKYVFRNLVNIFRANGIIAIMAEIVPICVVMKCDLNVQ